MSTAVTASNLGKLIPSLSSDRGRSTVPRTARTDVNGGAEGVVVNLARDELLRRQFWRSTF